jgi:hydroxymethylglutaryl-CoA lyase
VERALADLDAGYGANEISLLVSATESHTQKNLNRTAPSSGRTLRDGGGGEGRFRMVGTVSVAFGCPFEGKVDPAVGSRTSRGSRRWGEPRGTG